MTHRVHVQCHPAHARARPAVVRAARAALRHQCAPPGTVAIVLVGETRMRRLNREYAGQDAVTDVLAFSDGARDPDSGDLHFGDVILSVPVAARQARRARHSLTAEVSLLTVHGVLHLLGHDHAAPIERRRMEAAQRAILARLPVRLSPTPEAP